jgi:hypothetical protein
MQDASIWALLHGGKAAVDAMVEGFAVYEQPVDAVLGRLRVQSAQCQLESVHLRGPVEGGRPSR